jgi:hypothetical protein
VAVAQFEAERGVQIEPGVHTGHDGDTEDRPGTHARVGESGGVALIGPYEAVDDRLVAGGAGGGLGGTGCWYEHAGHLNPLRNPKNRRPPGRRSRVYGIQ